MQPGDVVRLKENCYTAEDFAPGKLATVIRVSPGNVFDLFYVKLTDPLRTGRSKEVGAGGGDLSLWPFLESELEVV